MYDVVSSMPYFWWLMILLLWLYPPLAELCMIAVSPPSQWDWESCRGEGIFLPGPASPQEQPRWPSKRPPILKPTEGRRPDPPPIHTYVKTNERESEPRPSTIPTIQHTARTPATWPHTANLYPLPHVLLKPGLRYYYIPLDSPPTGTCHCIFYL